MTEGTNPWIARPATASPTTVATTPAVARATGPLSPQRGVPAPDRVDQLPVVEHTRPADLWWVGTHGGAGESSLARLVPQWRPAGHGWPRVPGAGAPSRVVLVGRSNAAGLRAAQAAATQWAAGLVPFVEVVGLVIVADAPGRLPRPLRHLAQVVGGGVPRTWTVPWIEAWRLGEDVTASDGPREIRHLLEDLRVILQPGAAGATD